MEEAEGLKNVQMENVGAIIDRPPKNEVFRISRREITSVSPYGRMD